MEQRENFYLQKKHIEYVDSISESDGEKIMNYINGFCYSIGKYKSFEYMIKDKGLKVKYFLDDQSEEISVPLAKVKEYQKYLQDLLKSNNDNLCEDLSEQIKKSLNEVEKIIKENNGKKNITLRFIILGIYTRNDEYPNGVVKIYKSALQNKETLICTYVHEMMHAFFDHDHRRQYRSNKYVEEPLTELAMLNFMAKYYERDANGKNIYYNKALEMVKNKKRIGNQGLYGFGYYLHKHRNDVPWQQYMYDKKYDLSTKTKVYKEYIKWFRYGFYPFVEEYIYSHLLFSVLK